MALSFVDSAFTNEETITVPAAAAEGDFAILFDHARNASTVPTEVVPTGWTQIGTSLTGTATRNVISYKKLVSGDPESVITGMNGNSQDSKALLVFRASSGVDTISPSTWNGEATNGDPVEQNVAASGGTAPLIVFGMAGVTTFVSFSFSTASPAFDGTVGGATNNYLLVGYKIYNASPSDHAIDIDDLGTNNHLRSGYVAIAEVPGQVSGASALAFSSSGTLKGAAALTGAATPTFTVTGTVTGESSGALSGSAEPAFTLAGALKGAASLAGLSSPAFSGAGTITSTVALAGTATVTLALNGTIIGRETIQITGQTGIVFTGSGTMEALIPDPPVSRDSLFLRPAGKMPTYWKGVS